MEDRFRRGVGEIRFGVAGAGKLGGIHAKLIANVPDARLAGVYDVAAERAAEVAAARGAQAFASLEEMLSGIDALCIATPTSTHREIALAALDAGVHLFIEKPIASTVAEGREIVEKAESLGAVVMVGHVERFNPAFAATVERRPTPMFIEAHRLAGFSPRATDVSVVLDLMIHDIDLVLVLTGGARPSEIRASGVPVISDEIDIANARLEFPDGCVANLTASRISLQPMRKMRLFERDSYISIDFAKPAVDVYAFAQLDGAEADGSGTADPAGYIRLGEGAPAVAFDRPLLQPVNAIEQELIAFARAIRGEAPAPVTGGDGLAALEVAEEILRNIGRGERRSVVAV